MRRIAARATLSIVTRRAAEMLEYHQGPRLIIEAMERWLSEDDRAEQADRVRAWLTTAYGLDVAAPRKRAVRKAASRRKR